MKWRPVALAAALLVAGFVVTNHLWRRAHLRRMTGRADLGGLRCTGCHGVAESGFPWRRPRPRHPAPAGLALSAGGARLYVACSGADTVDLLDAAAGTRIATAVVPGRPFGLALCGDRLYVTCRSAGRVVCLDARTLNELETVSVGREPVALARVQRGASTRLVVANSGSDDLSVLATGPLRELARLPAGRQPFAVAAIGDGSRVLVANRLSRIGSPDTVPNSEATLVDPWHPRVLSRGLLQSAHLSEGAAEVPGRPWALVPCVRVRNLVPITQVAEGWVMNSGLAVVDLGGGPVVQLPLDELNACFADPSAVVVDASGRHAYVASGGGNAVSVVDLDRLGGWLESADAGARLAAADDLQLAAEYVVARIPTGPNPRHLALSGDARTLYVAEHLGDAVLAIDTATLAPKGRFRLEAEQDPDPVWRGARVFASAHTSFQGQFSCRSCHPGGHVDGLAYDFDIDGLGRNIVDNRSLLGVALTAPFKWNGKNPSLDVQCGFRFAVVLTRTDPIAGRDLEDLVAYIESLPPPRPPVKDSEPAVERGRRLFFATQSPDGTELPQAQRCSTCHPPPFYTNGGKSSVGERSPSDDAAAFDVPHLVGIGSSAPYLHDGRAASLEEIWTVHNPDDRHGITSRYSKHDLNDLIEFLKSL